MISLVFHSCESRLSFEMLHASTERRILCKRNFMQRGDGMECLVRQLVGVAVYHELRLCLGKLGLANLLHTSASQCGRGLPYIWEWLGVLLSLKLASARHYHGFCLLPVSAVSFLRSGTKLIFRRRSKQKEAGLSQSHDDLSNVTANSTTRKKAGSFSHRLIKRFSFKSKSKPKGSDNTSAGENWRREKPIGKISQRLFSSLLSSHSMVSVTCSPVLSNLGWGKTPQCFMPFGEWRWQTQDLGSLAVLA